VAGPDALNPHLTRGFLEYSQQRGFITDPARVRHPRDKPKVERQIPYVRERFFKGGQFLLHASTFLGPHRRYLDYVEPPPQQPERRSISEPRDDRELDSPREDFNRYSF
jgi:transposase